MRHPSKRIRYDLLDIRAASLTPDQRCKMLALCDQRVRPAWHGVVETLAFLVGGSGLFWLAWVVLA